MVPHGSWQWIRKRIELEKNMSWGDYLHLRFHFCLKLMDSELHIPIKPIRFFSKYFWLRFPVTWILKSSVFRHKTKITTLTNQNKVSKSRVNKSKNPCILVWNSETLVTSLICILAVISSVFQGFPDVLVVKNPPADAGDIGDVGSDSAQGRFPGGGHGNPTPVFSPGESHGQRELAGYSP